jgi:ribosomal protein S18 acetylase RimI-like enzyme
VFAEFEPRTKRRPRVAVHVRRAESNDLDALARLRAVREGGDPDASRTVLAAKLARAERGAEVLLVARAEDETVGYGGAGFLDRGTAPAGWYLTGVLVDPAWRRRGVATVLTRARLEWIKERAECAYYVANARNRVSIALHQAFGFEEITRDFSVPGLTFRGGVGILFRAELAGPV